MTCSSHLLDHRFLILILVLRCVRNVSVGFIKNRHTDLIPPQDCRRLWWGYQLGVHTCSYWLIVFIYLKYPEISSTKISFTRPNKELFIVDLCFYIYRISAILNQQLYSDVWENDLWDVSKLYILICYPHRLVEGCEEGYGWVFAITNINLLTLIKKTITIFIVLLLNIFFRQFQVVP